MAIQIHVPGDDGPVSVLLDGLDVAGCVTACSITLTPERPPEVELLLDTDELSLQLADADVTADLTSDVVAALCTAGWTPPGYVVGGYDDETGEAGGERAS